MAADIVIYDLEKLKVKPMETVSDLPDGDWRGVQKPKAMGICLVRR